MTSKLLCRIHCELADAEQRETKMLVVPGNQKIWRLQTYIEEAWQKPHGTAFTLYQTERVIRMLEPAGRPREALTFWEDGSITPASTMRIKHLFDNGQVNFEFADGLFRGKVKLIEKGYWKLN
jgi:hypothetical protein